MSTSLAEQLRRLQTPQSSQFIDTKKRDSILFTSKEAATKSRETVYEIGLSGLHELIEMNSDFEEFQSTLFELTAKDVQRAVETKEVNALLNKNIKRFMFHLSPYFMIPATHKCLEWLIRRFNINLYNKEELLMLILPYHQTNMFVRCVQVMKFDDPTNKWDFLSEVKKSSAPLSKYALWNHGATQPSFLGFVGKFTHEAIKEVNHKAGSLQTMIAFYCTTIIGAMEQAASINDNHLLSIVKYLVKSYKSDVIDFAAAGYMITAQLLVKAKLGVPLLSELMDKITSTVNPSLTQNIILLLSLMFQSQNDDLKVTDKALRNIMSFKWLLVAFEQMKTEGKPMIAFYRALICKLLEKIGDKNEDFIVYKEYCESLMSEVVLENDEAQIIIRAILDSYVLAPDESEEQKEEKKDLTEDEDEDEGIISLDSDDDDDNIPLKSQDVTLWYSTFLKTLERQYPVAFDEVVKVVMSTTPGRKRNGLKNVLGFLLKVSCANSDTNIFENLYHHNALIRTEAVAYLVQNFKKITLTNNESGDILRLTITERLNDDNPNVLLEVLNIEASQLLELVGPDEIVEKLTKVLMRFWKTPEKWEKVKCKALELLTSDGVHQCSDENIVLIAILPFLLPSDRSELGTYTLIKNSSYGKTSELIKALPKNVQDFSASPSSLIDAFKKAQMLPSSESVLSTIKSILLENQKGGSISVQFSFLLLAFAIEPERNPEFSVRAVHVIKEVLVKRKLTLMEAPMTNKSLFKTQHISTEAVTVMLKNLITNTYFEGMSISFSQQTVETKLKLELFEFLVEKLFAATTTERSSFNDVIKVFLDTVCKSNHLTKILFFSQFCASHVVYQESDSSLELQIRTMRLLNHVLKNNQEHVSSYPNEFFQNILISLTAEQTIIREFGMEIVTTLHQQKIPASWKFLFEKLDDRKSEILMDSEQLSLILFLITSKKSSAHLKQIVEGFLLTIQDSETFDYIQASLLMTLKHLTEKKVLEVMIQVASKLISNKDETILRYDDYQSSIIKLVLMKINQTTISTMWNLTSFSLDCHRLLSDDDGRYLTPSILVLKAIDKDVFAKLHPDHRILIFHQIVKCSMNEHPRIVQTANKTFLNLDIDCKMVKAMLIKMPTIDRQQKGEKKKTDSRENPTTSVEWKEGVTLLELLQNKSKGMANQHELIPVLFDVLENCLKSSAESSMEYTRQIVLSLLLNICQKVSPDGKAHRALRIQDSMLKTELVIRCIKESENPQTHHHSLLLLAQLALMTPDQVLNDMMAIFTFVGTTLIRHEDSYSFQIISKIIENVVPTLALGKRGDYDVIPILKIFASIILQVPDHRRLMLYVKLLSTLDVNKYLWMFVGLVMESQVSAHQKGVPQEELPQRVQIALAIAKEFEVKTIVESSTSLIVYLKDFPMFIETKPGAPTTAAEEESHIFSLKTHTDVQLRHFKYLILQFLKNLLSSPEVSAKVSHLSNDTKMEMKGMFQDIILNVLTLIPEISKALDHPRTKPVQKSWHAILQNSFDILEAAIELLSPDMLLVVVENLMLHEFLLVRKKVIELLNRKLEEKYFDVCEDRKLMKLMVPLQKICDTIGRDEGTTALEVVQQSALTSIKLLARKLSEDNPEEFVGVLEKMTEVIDSEKIKTAVLVNLVVCVAELTADLKVRAIGMLGSLMPSILRLMTVREDDPVAFLLLYSAVSALLRIIETVPLFLSPYLSQIISQLTRLSPGLKLLQDGKITLTITKITKIWTTLAQLVPNRVLVPAIEEVYDKVVHKGLYASVEPLMELMCEIFQNAESKDVKSHQSELTEFFVKAMQFRCEVEGKFSIGFQQINDVELCVIRALVALVMKLSEGSFRPLFESIYTWAIRDEPDNFNRAITFYRWTSEVSAALKSLFLLFSSDLIDSAGPMLDKCNSSKHNSDSCFGEDKAKNLFLTEHILLTLNNIFLHDHQHFINTQRFDVIMQPIVDQIENEFVLADENMQQLVRSCVAQLAVAASDDILWKQLNYQVLMKTRSDSVEERIFGLKVCVEMAKKLGEDFEPLVPETIPFLSELLEDEDYRVLEACQNGVRELETTVGESLQKYF